MPRKIGSKSKECRTPSARDKRLVKSIYVGASNAIRWNCLKKRLRLGSDVELVHHLLDLADSSQEKRSPDQGESIEPEEGKNDDDDISSAAELPQEKLQPLRNHRRNSLRKSDVVEENADVTAPEPDNVEHNSGHKEETGNARKSKSHTGKKAHKHHRKKKHHRSGSGERASKEPIADAAEKQPESGSDELLKSSEHDNHKHHHDRKKSSSSSRGKKKRKHKDRSLDVCEKPSKQHHVEEIVSIEDTENEDNHRKETVAEAKFDTHSHQSSVVENEPTSPIVPEPKHKRKHKKKYKKRSSVDTRKAPVEVAPEPASVAIDCPASPQRDETVHLTPEPMHSAADVVEIERFPVPAAPPPPIPAPLVSSTDLAPELPGEMTPSCQNLDSPRVAIKLKLCIECSTRHLQDSCPLHNAELQVKDDIALSEWVSLPESSRQSFAEESLPASLVALEERDATHGPSIVAKVILKRLTQFGPLHGERIREMDIADDFNMRDIWEICTENDKFYLSTLSKDHSNWLRYMRPAPTREKRNVAAVVKNGRLYFVTLNIILPGTELLFWLECAASGWSKKKMERTNCGGCNLKFSNSLYYRIHCSVFHDPNFSLTIRKYHCKVCGLSVLGKENIMKHAAEQHGGKGAYQCQFCKKFFLRLNYLEMHRTYGCAANPQRTRPLCDFCGRKFCQPQKLKVHIKRMHSDLAEVLKEFQCKMCHKLLGSRAALQRHLKEVHHKDMIGACTCDRCGKMFQNKSNLKIHMLTHSGVKPFRCKEGTCNAAFTTKQCLQFHYKKVHGFSEESMPKIERCVAYTFDAYAGGQKDDSGDIDDTISPPFTPTGSEDSSPPSPSLPSLEDDETSQTSNLAIVNETNSVVMDSNLGSVQPDSVISNSSSPPAMLSPTNSPMTNEVLPRSGAILSKASKKWMGDIIVSPTVVMGHQEEMHHEKRWHSDMLQHQEQVIGEPEIILEKNRWGEEVNNLRNEISSITRRSELSGYSSRIIRPETMNTDLPDGMRRSPSSSSGDFGNMRRSEPDDFGPLRRTEPSASLLVEAALDAAERDLTVKLAELKTIPMEPLPVPTQSGSNTFLSRINGMHPVDCTSDADYVNIISNKGSRIPETGLDMSYKQYEPEMVVASEIAGGEYRVMRSPELIFEHPEQGLDMSRSSAYPGGGPPAYARYPELLPPHLHPHHRAAVAAAGLMYEMEPARCQQSPPPPSPPPPYQAAELLRHHWHHLPPTAHHTLDLSTARGAQVSPDQSISPPPPTVYQNYPPSPAPYHAGAPQPRAPTPNYHQHSGYYYSF